MNLITLKRQTLFVTFICYLPHITTEPWWIFIIFLATISYRIIADYFSYPPIPRWILFFLLVGSLLLLVSSVSSNGFLIRCLLVFIILKCLEIRTIRDIQALIFCNFFLIVSALLVVNQLGIILYLFIGILANLSLMLKLSASKVSLRQMGGKSSKQLLIAIPFAVILFFVFPRIEPFWQVPSLSKASIGFNETMSPGSISELYNDDSIVMQITFTKNPILKGYWRGLILSFYTGEVWQPANYNRASFAPLPNFKINETADYEIILEPNQKKWLFYAGYPIAGESNLLFSSTQGLISQNNQPVKQTFIYSLKVQPAPYYVLNVNEYAEDTEIPNDSNPRLVAWAKQHFTENHNDINAFIAFLRNYINQQPFWYTLTPPLLNSDKNQMDHFWFDTQKGFCEHYASAVTFILRVVGIPARVIVGYQGGQWNPISHAITLRQNDAHAWVEFWQQNVGWQQLDPTTFIAADRIDQTIRNHESNLVTQESYFSLSELLFPQKVKFIFQSIRFFSERWLLLYNQDCQQNLFANMGLGKWKSEQLLQAALGSIILFLILMGIYYQWSQRRKLDRLLVEYHLLQKEFRRFNIETLPSATLKQQCNSLINKAPDLNSILSSFIYHYDEIRLKQSENNTKENKKQTIALFKTLRRTLRGF